MCIQLRTKVLVFKKVLSTDRSREIPPPPKKNDKLLNWPLNLTFSDLPKWGQTDSERKRRRVARSSTFGEDCVAGKLWFLSSFLRFQLRLFLSLPFYMKRGILCVRLCICYCVSDIMDFVKSWIASQGRFLLRKIFIALFFSCCFSQVKFFIETCVRVIIFSNVYFFPYL